jgi:hypothetical protein
MLASLIFNLPKFIGLLMNPPTESIFDKFKTALKESGEELSKWYDKTNKDLEAWSIQASADISAWIVTTDTNLETWSTDASAKLGAWISQADKDLEAWSTQASADLAAWFTVANADVLAWSTTASANIAAWITQAAQSVSTWASAAATAVGTWASKQYTIISTWFAERYLELSTWLSERLVDFVNWVEDVGKEVSAAFQRFFGPGGGASQVLTDFYDFGANLVKGIVSGITSVRNDVWLAIKALVENAYQKALALMGEHSPSKVYDEYGRNLVLGMVEGIRALEKLPQDAMARVVSAMFPSALGNGGLVSGRGNSTSISTVNNNYSVQVNPSYSQVQTPTGIYYDVTAALASTRR